MTAGVIAPSDWGRGAPPPHGGCSDGIVDHPGPDYFALILHDYLRTGAVAVGTVGSARGELLDAGDLVRFATSWMETDLRPLSGGAGEPRGREADGQALGRELVQTNRVGQPT